MTNPPADHHVGRSGRLQLKEAVARYIREHNKTPKPFVWTQSGKAILAKLDRLPVPSEWVSALDERTFSLRRKLSFDRNKSKIAAQKGD